MKQHCNLALRVAQDKGCNGTAAARPGLIRRLREGSGAAMVALGLGLALAGRPST
jgi:hypothetical protein